MRRLVLLSTVVLSGCPLALSDFAIGDAAVVDAAEAGEACAGQVCNGACVDTSRDSTNCGSCGHACVAGHACAASKCAPWAGVSAAPGGARDKAAGCALSDGRVFVWGGEDGSGNPLASGALYDPATDAWSAIATQNAPSARVLASAVCEGQEAIVWGGGDPSSTADYKDGAIYDASSDTWSTMSVPPGALVAARAAYGEHVGTGAAFWCGVTKSGAAANGAGAFYDPSQNTWTANGGGGPQALLGPAVAASSTLYVVFAGQAGATDGNDLFTLQGVTWTKSSASGSPSARHGAFAAYDGTVFVAWGGASGTNPLQSGGTFTLPSGPWKTTSVTADTPSARAVALARTGWAAAIGSGKTLVVGGVLVSNALAHDGAVYDSAADAWTSVPAWSSSDDHEWGVAVWTGKELVVWGGRTGSTLSATGDRFAPAQ